MNRNYVPANWDDFFNDKFYNGTASSAGKSNVPAVNVSESEASYTIEMAAPGLIQEDFKIELENDLLTISHEQGESKEEQKPNYLRREFSIKDFKRSFQMPDTIDAAKITADFVSGILSIELPKKAEVVENAHRKITINSK